jgi:hypothetical protein
VSRGNQGHISGSAALSEAQFHRAVAGFLNARLMPPDFFSTFPAGGGGKMRGRILKASGLKAGMPDIFPLIINGYLYGIELKVGRGVLSDTQKDTHAKLLATRAVTDIAICWPSADNGLDQIRSVLDVWGARLRSASASAEKLQMSIDAWNRSHEKSSVGLNFSVDSFPASDQIGSRRPSRRSLSRS